MTTVELIHREAWRDPVWLPDVCPEGREGWQVRCAACGLLGGGFAYAAEGSAKSVRTRHLNRHHGFNPDWVVGPAATLADWMAENGVGVLVLATAAVGRERRDRAVPLIRDVLEGRPLGEAHAAVLERGTRVPARFWLNHEHNYRAGLTAGLKDTTGDVMRRVPYE